MKLGLCLEMVFEELPFAKRFEQAAQLGFTNVEMWYVDLSFKGSPAELAALAAQHDVTITNTVIGACDGSLGGGLTHPANRDQWLDRVRMTLDFNKKAGIGAAVVCTGNVIDGMTDTQMRQSVVDGLKETAKIAEDAGITLLLEPLNTTCDHPGYWLDNSTVGAEICREVASERLKLLYDCYHMQIMEGDLLGHIEAQLDVIGHIHVAGHPGRHELWLGEINYPFIISRLKELGYEGVFGLEYSPTLDSAESLSKTREYIGMGARENPLATG